VSGCGAECACDECLNRQIERRLADRARERRKALRAEAHAAGYAEAVGDIRKMVNGLFLDSLRRQQVEDAALGIVLSMLDNGAHVGAAKKGGAT
jgi:hypothetical protein